MAFASCTPSIAPRNPERKFEGCEVIHYESEGCQSIRNGRDCDFLMGSALESGASLPCGLETGSEWC
jgi:hypothetical protein